jgi:hypothetical protein
MAAFLAVGDGAKHHPDHDVTSLGDMYGEGEMAASGAQSVVLNAKFIGTISDLHPYYSKSKHKKQ